MNTPQLANTQPVAEPPSLRRRAPARIDLSLKSGRCPGMTCRRVNLRAGWMLIVQVVPPSAVAVVEVVSEPPLMEIVKSRIESGAVPTYYVEYIGRPLRRLIPLPVTGKLYISTSDGHANPCRVTIPVTVWPSVWTLVLWWFVAYLSILGTRWRNTLSESQSAWDVFPKIRGDLPFLVELLLLGVVVIGALCFIGWLIIAAEPGDRGSQ